LGHKWGIFDAFYLSFELPLVIVHLTIIATPSIDSHNLYDMDVWL